MSFAPGEAYQFDWSHETITLQNLPLTIKAAHMKLSHSRMPFVRGNFRETQELCSTPTTRRSSSMVGPAGAAAHARPMVAAKIAGEGRPSKTAPIGAVSQSAAAAQRRPARNANPRSRRHCARGNT
jgi:hypothetical protein